MSRLARTRIRVTLLLVGLLAVLLPSSAAAQVETTDLGHLGGGSTYPNDLSSLGHVVGQSRTTTGEWDAFIWRDGVMSLLGSTKHPVSNALSVNSLGQAVGYHQLTTGKKRAVVWLETTMIAIGYDLEYLYGATSSMATHINEAGQVAGTYTDSRGFSYGFLWQTGIFTKLGQADKIVDLADNGQTLMLTAGGLKIKTKFSTYVIDPDGTASMLYMPDYLPVRGYDLNNRGQVAGSDYYRTIPIWVDTTVTLRVTPGSGLGGIRSVNTALNDLGLAVGNTFFASSTRAYLWDPTTSTASDLGTLGGNRVLAYGINNANQVVGYATNAIGEYHAYLWEDGVITGLDPTGYDSAAELINDLGQMVGYSMDGKNYRALMWTKAATPEDQIESIEANIDNLLEENVLNEGQTNSFQSTLDNLMASIDKGNANSTCGQLGSLTKKIESAMQSGKLTTEEGNALLDSAAQLEEMVCAG